MKRLMVFCVDFGLLLLTGFILFVGLIFSFGHELFSNFDIAMVSFAGSLWSVAVGVLLCFYVILVMLDVSQVDSGWKLFWSILAGVAGPVMLTLVYFGSTQDANRLEDHFLLLIAIPCGFAIAHLVAGCMMIASQIDLKIE